MKLNQVTSGVYKIANVKTNWIYIGESVNIEHRITSHFVDLKNNRHVNFGMQDHYNKHGLDSFEYEIIDVANNVSKQGLRRLEQNYIDKYTSDGYSLYNGQNNTFLHVKEDRQNAKRAKNNKGAIPGHAKLLRNSSDAKCKSSNNLESDQSRHDATISNSSNGKKGNGKNAGTKRSKKKSVDENRRSGQSYQNNLPALPLFRHHNKTDTRPLEDWYLFCDGDLWKDEHPYYCPGKGCGRHLIINMDDREEMLYALYTYLQKEDREWLGLMLCFEQEWKSKE